MAADDFEVGIREHMEGMLSEMHGWLRARREAYNEASEKLKDPDNVKALLLGILDHLEDALGFNFREQTAAEAFAVIAKQQCEFAKLLTRMSLIEEYELRSKEAIALQSKIEAVKAGELQEADLAKDDLGG